MLTTCARRLALLLLLASGAYGQTLYRYENILLNQNGQPIVGVNVYVCTGQVTPNFASNPPCPLASIFSDVAGLVPITQPITTNPLGNYAFTIQPPAVYTVVFTGLGVKSSDIITIPISSGQNVTLGTSGNASIKYPAASAYRYVDAAGSDSNDGLSPGSAYATPQKCNTVVVALGGGTCDARTLYNYSYSTEIDVGQHSSPVPVTLLLPPFGNWTCNVPGGTLNCLKVFQFGNVVGTSAGQGTQFVITASSSANVVDVCGTEPAPVAGSAYIRMEGGLGCASASGAVVSGAVIHIQKLFDISRISDLSSGASSVNTKGLWIHGVCCGTLVERVKGNGNLATGNVPCTLGSNSDLNSGADIGPISCTGAGSGQLQVAIVQFNGGNGGAHYHDVYTEADLASDTTSNVVGVTGSSGNGDILDRLVLGADQSGSTRYMVDIASGASLIIRNLQLATISPNAINDHNAGRGAISPGASTVITDYSTQNVCCSLVGYFSKPSMYGLTNNTGLQLFNTATTCTTGASVGATCTTAAITLPVAEADTAYRVACTGKGLTNVPVVISTTNSSASQFTITIAALTAAAASFASYDCHVGHN